MGSDDGNEENTMHGAYIEIDDWSVNYGVVDKPKPEPGQVLIKVESCAMNHADLMLVDGEFSNRLSFEK